MSTEIKLGQTPRKAKAAGRPRRLTTEQVIETALAIGLEGLTMSAVAKRLGVSITVLYGYVSSREELVRVAASFASEQHKYPEDHGQHWSVYVAQYAATLFAFLTGPGQVIGQYFGGGTGPQVEIDRAEVWLQAMTVKGFAADHALLLMRQMGETVIGGAVTALHKRALEANGKPFGEAAYSAMAARDPTQIPLLLSQQADFARRDPVWPQTLLRLLEAEAAKRNEKLDSPLLTRVLETVLDQP